CFETEIDRLAPDDTAVLAIPLLFEAKMTDLVTEIWVVSCDRQTQLNRMMTRDSLTATFQQRIDATAAQRRIDSQMSLTDKIALADVNLDNSTNITNLEAQIDRLF
ncbi:MAG: dephospho-CoA kinase, partial [Chamaesiphon sp.]|nr:dephospho-CoA kinase [Chamaesiphon sp.]